jgi:hypothetical protein
MNAMNMTQIRSLAPAAFSIAPDAHLTDSYSHVTTANVIDALQQDGWIVTDARQVRSRSLAKLEHRKHEISLTHPDLPTHAEGSPLMRLANSSDGGCAFRLIGGFLRSACTNQLYTGIKAVGGVYHHRGDGLEDRIVAGAREARKNFDRVISAVDLWRSIELSPEQQMAFARQALGFRWPNEKSAPARVSIQYSMARRYNDNGNNLWLAFNRTQESLMRGGWMAGFRQYNDEGIELAGHSYRRVKQVTSLTASERINTQLWQAAEAIASGQEVVV